MYRTIDARFWSDPKVKNMTLQAKLLFLYFVTNPHTHVSGIYYLPRTTICQEVGMAAAATNTLCDTLSRLGLVRFDQEKDIVWVVNMMHYQGKGDKNARSAAYHVCEDLHNSFLVNEFFSKYPSVYEYAKDRIKIPYRSPIQPKDVGATPEQEQEQEQEQEIEIEAHASPKPPKEPFPPSIEDVTAYCQERGKHVDPQKFIDYYTSNGWKVGKNTMKDWRACVRTWENNGYSNTKSNDSSAKPRLIDSY